MSAADRMLLVLAGTLLVCTASAGPQQPPAPAAIACDLLQLPARVLAERMTGGHPRSGDESRVAVAVAGKLAAEPKLPRPRESSMCSATGGGVSVSLRVFRYADQRDAARGYQAWDCVDGRSGRVIRTSVDHGCAWGSESRSGLQRQGLYLSYGEAQVLIGRTVVMAIVVGDDSLPSAPALAAELVTVAVERLRSR